MEGPGKVIRIFVCSTFKEFEEERNLLANEVFPALREMCRREGMVFRAVDLRWGISDEDSANHRTVPICLEEVRKCQEQSPDLNFLVMAGSDYGSVLAPEEIPAEDWDLLIRDGALDTDAYRRLKDWYFRDYNTDKSPYRFSAVGNNQDTPKWIQAVLSRAAERALPDERKKQYTASVTELEISQGLFSVSGRGTVVAIRQPAQELPANAKGSFRSPEKEAALRRRMQDYMELTGRTDKMIVYGQDKASFISQIAAALEEGVKQRIQAVREWEKNITPLSQETASAEASLRMTAETYLDMNADLSEFTRFVEQNRGRTVLVTGEQGVGKTTFLRTWAYKNDAVSVFGDIQVSGQTVERALGYLTAQMYNREIMPGTPGDQVEAVSIEEFGKLLNRYRKNTNGNSVTIIIDSMEQLHDYEQQYDSLFRLSIPPWMTLVVSCINRRSLTLDEQRRNIPEFSVLPLQNVESGWDALWKLIC